MIRAFLKEDHREWDEHVHEIAYAINNAPHDSLSGESAKFSLYFWNFGRNPVAPDSEYGRAISSVKIDKRDPKFWQVRIKRLVAYQDLVKRFLSKASAKQAKVYNQGRRETEFKVGDMVM